MTASVVLVTHMDREFEERENWASRYLADQGFALEWTCPAVGDRLPTRNEDHVGAIVFGGAQCANDVHEYFADELAWIGDWVDSDTPFLGICLGGQLLAKRMGAEVWQHPKGVREIGFRKVEASEAGASFLNGLEYVYHWHRDGFDVPAGAELLATGETFPNQAYRMGRRAYGLQFHPEMTLAHIERWTGEVPEQLTLPGADDKQRQLDDADRHLAAMNHWFGDFLDDWVA